MKTTDTITFAPGGREMLERIVAIWPPIIRQGKADKIITMLDMLMKTRRLRRADSALVIEATRLVVPKSYDPLFDMFQDMEAFKKGFLDTFTSAEACLKIPVQVRRWKPARRKRTPAGKKMTVLGFCASPRRRGNTDLLVEEALRGAAEAGARTEKIMLQNVTIGYCIGCRKCKEQGFEKICPIPDDMSAIYDKIIAADALVVGFPIYTGRACAQLCTFFDRWDAYERYLLTSLLEPGRRAMVIGTWGYPAIDTYDHVIEDVISILNLHKVETVEAVSACGFEGMFHGLDPDTRRGILSRTPKLLKKARTAGRALVR